MNEGDRPRRSGRAGKRASERAAFFAAHPRCCFCNGERPAEEPDHVPARICFRSKEGPEGFEFPACSQCNRAAATSEQVAALHFRMFDHNGDNLREEDLVRLVEGVANNAPETLPIFPESLRRQMASHSPGDDLGAPPVMTITPAANSHIDLFATKALYAMYYRVSGGLMAGPRHRRLVIWAQVGTLAAKEVARMAEACFGQLRVGTRTNTDIGDQFHYRHGYNVAHGYLGLSMSFGQSLTFFCVLGPAKQLATLDDGKPLRYQPIRELGVALKRRRA